MTLAVKLLLIAALVLGIIIPFGTFLLGEKSKKRYKRTIGANAFFFFGAFVVAGIMLFSGMPAQAAEAGLCLCASLPCWQRKEKSDETDSYRGSSYR